MKFGVVIFPGSNCDHDVLEACRMASGQDAVQLWHKEHDLKGADFIVIPGGFSYGDYLRCGAIAKFSPVMAAVRQFAHEGGLVIGICNGFQILVETGMLPGALVGVILEKLVESKLRSPLLIACTTAGWAIVMWIADRRAAPAPTRAGDPRRRAGGPPAGLTLVT